MPSQPCPRLWSLAASHCKQLLLLLVGFWTVFCGVTSIVSKLWATGAHQEGHDHTWPEKLRQEVEDFEIKHKESVVILSANVIQDCRSTETNWIPMNHVKASDVHPNRHHPQRHMIGWHQYQYTERSSARIPCCQSTRTRPLIKYA